MERPSDDPSISTLMNTLNKMLQTGLMRMVSIGPDA
jgi:hypothetical protein